MKKTYFLILCFYLALSGCATPYQESGFRGGFSQTKIQTNVFRIDFDGNGYVTSERIRDYALLRAAELTLESANRYFVVINSTDGGRTFTTPRTAYHTGQLNSSGQYSGTTYFAGGYTVFKPSSSIMIHSFPDSQPMDGLLLYDAEQVATNLREKYNIKKGLYGAEGNFDKKIEKINKQIEENPNNPDAYSLRSKAYFDKGDRTQALRDANRALELDPNSQGAILGKAVILQSTADYAEAIRLYTHFLDLNQTYFQIYPNRAFCYFQIGDYEKAWADVKKAQALKVKVDKKLITELHKYCPPPAD